MIRCKHIVATLMFALPVANADTITFDFSENSAHPFDEEVTGSAGKSESGVSFTLGATANTGVLNVTSQALGVKNSDGDIASLLDGVAVPPGPASPLRPEHIDFTIAANMALDNLTLLEVDFAQFDSDNVIDQGGFDRGSLTFSGGIADIDFDEPSGDFASNIENVLDINQSLSPLGDAFSLFYRSGSGFSIQSLTFGFTPTASAVVPEPSSFALLMLVAIATFLRKQSRRARARQLL